jgi:hypothetical protein
MQTPQVPSEAAAEVHPDMIHYGVTKTGQVARLVTYPASPLSSNTNGAALRSEGGILRSLF